MIVYLALLRHENAEPSPRLLGKIWSCDTFTASMNTEPVSETRRAILFLIGGASRPFIPCYRRQHIISKAKIESQSTHGLQSTEENCVTDLLENEPANFLIPFAPRPYDEDITTSRQREVQIIQRHIHFYHYNCFR